MKIALSILKQYVDFNVSCEELCKLLAKLGFEIEGVEHTGYCGQGPLCVGQVLKKSAHPNADHLHVCQVDVGQKEALEIVCGATNFKEGDFVPVALPGAQLGDLVLKISRIRGVTSNGMLCSAKELGLSSDHDGLLILNHLNVKAGESLDKLFSQQKDTILDLSVTPNRGDCLSYIGIAREIAAALDTSVHYPECTLTLPSAKDIHVEIQSNLCNFYAACHLSHVHVGPSPEWLKYFLQTAGIRSINNVVDITNFILLEQGQPLHAFDGKQIHQKRLYVRTSTPGESMETLDGVKRQLPEGALLIADNEGPLAIAGIMGGISSEIEDHTTEVILECAHFDVDCIRRTTQKLNLHSESSYRYERFVDRTRAKAVLQRAVQLLQSLDPQLVVEQSISVGSDTVNARTIDVQFSDVEKLLGFHVDPQLFLNYLGKLNFHIETQSDKHWTITVPVYRPDVEQVADLVEEFLRLLGSENIPSKNPCGTVCSLSHTNTHLLRQKHAQILSSHGFYECYTDTLQARTLYEDLLPESTIKALSPKNPLSEEHNCLRPSLIPGLLNVLSENRNHGNSTERLFESGHIFKVKQDGSLCELFASAFIVCPSHVKTWQAAPQADFYQLQALLQALISASGLSADTVLSATKETTSLWQKDYAGHIGSWEKRGFEANLGCVSLNFTQHWLKEEIVLAAECMWVPDLVRLKKHKLFQAYSECPSIRKDLALWVDKGILAETLHQHIEKVAHKWIKKPVQLQEVRLFDVYDDANNANQKSLAFSLTFGSSEGTLTDVIVNEIFEKIQSDLEQQYHYKVRKAI